jgi:hypothetical protein
MISRRAVILVLGSMPSLACVAASQTGIQVRRVGLLSSAAPLIDATPMVTGLIAGFTNRGYVVGSTLIFERRAAEGHPERLPSLVDDLTGKAELLTSR